MKNLWQSFVKNHPMVTDSREFKFKKAWKNKTYFLGLFLFIVATVIIGSFILLIPLSFPINFLLRTDFMQTWRDANPVWSEFMVYGLQLIIGFGGIYLVMALFTKYIEKRPFRTLGFVGRKKGIKMLRGFILGLASTGLTFLFVLVFTPSTLSTDGHLIAGVAALPVVLLFMIPWAVQATAEEVVFQGWLVPHLTKRNGVITAIIFSAIVFAFVHITNPNMGVLVFINLALYGVFAALYMLYEKSIYGIAAYHMSWNWSLGQIFGATMSEDERAISIFGLNREGNALLTGGPLGADGSIFETVMLILLIGGILYLQHRRVRRENNGT